MSSELAINQPSPIINLDSFSPFYLVSKYNNTYNALVKVHQTHIKNRYSPYESDIREMQSLAKQIRDIATQQNGAIQQNIEIHSHYQNLTDIFLGKEKLACFSPAIEIADTIQRAISSLLEGNQEPFNSLELPPLLHRAESIITKCSFIYNMTTSMDSNITANFNSVFNNNDISQTAICAGDCTSHEGDNA